ncbi:hypothetical protein KCU79_g66, partial [Aureobasidium melanogenum]
MISTRHSSTMKYDLRLDTALLLAGHAFSACLLLDIGLALRAVHLMSPMMVPSGLVRMAPLVAVPTKLRRSSSSFFASSGFSLLRGLLGEAFGLAGMVR